jgi:hypothetical protein
MKGLDESRNIATTYKARQIIADGDMTTKEGVKALLGNLAGVNWEIAKEVGEFAIAKQQADAYEKQMTAYGQATSNEERERVAKRAIKGYELEYRADGKKHTVASWAAENISEEGDFIGKAAEYFGLGGFVDNDAITPEMIKGTDSIPKLKSLLKIKGLNTEQIDDIVKEVEKKHLVMSELYSIKKHQAQQQLQEQKTTTSKTGTTGKPKITKRDLFPNVGSSGDPVDPVDPKTTEPASASSDVINWTAELWRDIKDTARKGSENVSGMFTENVLPVIESAVTDVSKGVQEFPTRLAQSLPDPKDVIAAIPRREGMLTLSEFSDAAKAGYRIAERMFTEPEMDSDGARKQVEQTTKKVANREKLEVRARAQEALKHLVQLDITEENKVQIAEGISDRFKLDLKMSMGLVELALKNKPVKTYFGNLAKDQYGYPAPEYAN